MDPAKVALLRKYDVPGPRYTSYPTVPYWERSPDEAEWITHLKNAYDDTLRAHSAYGVALYVHIPFCRSLCTYCGCNMRVTRSRTFVAPYVAALLKEWGLYRARLGVEKLILGEIHLGGGTPTYLNEEELAHLMDGILESATLTTDAALSIEVDPRVTNAAQLQTLAQRGFSRVSLGVQDFDPRVQDIVNRVQSEEEVARVCQAARQAGYRSINFDLIYGLPLQTPQSIEMTLDVVERLRPERIAFYSYAHVPWIKPGQRRFTEADLPIGEHKRALYELGRARLEKAGYREVGLDHFALPHDSLWQAAQSGTLHRNFMGYTPVFAAPLIGLGVSSIGDAVTAFAQNEKELNQYHERLARDELPLYRGHVLDAEDQVLRQHILNLMCRFETQWDSDVTHTDFLKSVPQRLQTLIEDELVQLKPSGCTVPESGRPFIRNICMAFDARLARRAAGQSVFSRTV